MTRLQRRTPVHVRRDAARQLSNGRVLYDALFSRVGLQGYGDSIEFRPPEEVFAPASLATLANLPATLLHPSTNYGTSFGDGSYPVRGTTGDAAKPHADGIHTAGTIMVWCDEWNAAIATAETAELSLGYTIDPDPTPGQAPPDMPGVAELGRAYAIVHRNITGDHCAGVPAGNAGTARVVADARSVRATRHALAEIAAARMDARPLHFVLGQWPKAAARKDNPMNPDALKALITQLRSDAKPGKGKGKRKDAAAPRLDGLADVFEKLLMLGMDHPDIASAIKPIAAEIKALIDPDSAAAEPEPADPGMDPAIADYEEDEPAMKADAVKQLIAVAVADALTRDRSARLDAADTRADALELARVVFGRDYVARKDGRPIATAEIMEAVVGRHDARALARIDAKHGSAASAKRMGAIESEFERVREAVADAAYRGPGDQLLEVINGVRVDARDEREEQDARLDAVAKRNAEHFAAAKAGRAVAG